MTEQCYTHALWKVKPGNETQFPAAWQELGQIFLSLPSRPLWGALLQSVTEWLSKWRFAKKKHPLRSAWQSPWKQN